MRSYGHLWLFVFPVLIGFDGPGANATNRGPGPSDPREADTSVLGVAPAALPACPWTQTEDSRGGLDSVTRALAAAASAAPPSPSRLRSLEAEWLSFRRPFAETVSYRTTAPPFRIA